MIGCQLVAILVLVWIACYVYAKSWISAVRRGCEAIAPEIEWVTPNPWEKKLLGFALCPLIAIILSFPFFRANYVRDLVREKLDDNPQIEPARRAALLRLEDELR
jgi:hypothetical protein